MSTAEDREWDAHWDRISGDQDERTMCHYCGGEGVVFGPTPGSAGAPWEYKCGDCDGTGRIDPDDYEMEYEG